jgi:hypothetical protein
MNIHKHMEVIFVVALATVGLGSFALDSMQEAEASASAPVMRNVAASGTQQGTAAVAIVCASRAARRA